MFRHNITIGSYIGALLLATATAHAAVTISSGSTQNMSCSSGVCSPTAASANLSTSDLENYLSSGNLTITTTGSAQANDIVVTSSFNWASANSLTLDAYHSVTVEQPVADNGSGAVTLTTNDGGSNGALSFISGGSLSFLGTSNSLTINGASYTLVSAISTLASDIAKNPSGFYALASNYNAKNDGIYNSAPIPTTFTGSFNGLGNVISNLSVNDVTTGASVGLFAEAGASGDISSLNIAKATVKAAKNSYAGVLVAQNFGMAFNDSTSGKVRAATGTSGAIYGGLVGNNNGTISSSSSSVDVVAKGNSGAAFADVGGLAGANGATIEQSYATGSANVGGASTAALAGGLVGFSGGAITNCYAQGNAAVKTKSGVGGLAGENALTVSSAYSTGSAKGGKSSYIGGSIGGDVGTGITDDYWDTTTSKIKNQGQGAGNKPNDPGITGLTTAQLQAGLPTGFDPTIWAENPSINNGLPYLINNPPQ